MAKPGDSSSSSSSDEQQQLGLERQPQISAYAVGEDAPVQGTDQNISPTRAQQTGGNGGNNVRAEGVTDDVNVAGGPPEGPTRKRRVRNEEQGSSSLGAQKPKRKAELLDPPARDPDCVVCGKHFNSWKALFGHMRSHPERQWRGVFPPPTGSWDPLGSPDRSEVEAGTGTGRMGPRAQEEIASTLLNVAQGVMSRMNPVIGAGGVDAGSKGTDEPAPSAAKDSTSSPARGLGIDLNEPQESSSPQSPRFDLNMPAPEDDDEGNDSS